LVPALQTTKVDLNETLKEGGGKGVNATSGSRVRNGLVVLEVALTLVLLIGAGLMIKSFASLLRTDLGFQAENVLTFELDLPNQDYPDPYWQSPSPYMRMVVRTSVPPRTLVNATQRQVWDLDRELPVGKLNSMDELVSKSASQQRSNMVLLTLFAAVALVLAAFGIYGVVSYSVTQRTHEIGIRMALGASRSDILKLIITRGMTLTAIGIVVGIAGAYGLTRALRSLLFGVGTLDIAIFVIVPIVFGVIALLACFFPARKASQVDPLIALRYE
jgi:putative ABC transport system permease protein